VALCWCEVTYQLNEPVDYKSHLTPLLRLSSKLFLTEVTKKQERQKVENRQFIIGRKSLYHLLLPTHQLKFQEISQVKESKERKWNGIGHNLSFLLFIQRHQVSKSNKNKSGVKFSKATFTLNLKLVFSLQ
jgi:hypothetical protein